MCGICGILDLTGGAASATSGRRAGAMLSLLTHRGPHESRLEAVPSGSIGATRLAIRGVDNGSQPMIDPATGVVVACNGEIDNHRELRAHLESRGHRIELDTDIAVIPALYLEHGEAFPEHLVGSFAAAVWDPRVRRLLLVRDRAGEKPLFYGVFGAEVSFASEIASLLEDGRISAALDDAAIAHYLRFGCFAAPAAPLANARRVAPGEIVAIDAAGVRRRRYWRLRFAEDPTGPPTLDEFDRIFRAGVTRQLDADVPRGVFLSGGLDSALVATVARSVRPDLPMHAYTVRFAEASYDEDDGAKETARRLALPWVAVDVAARDFPEEIAKLVATSGEPLGDPAWVPVAKLARRAVEDVRLVLVGEGADELFGGYPTYLGAVFAERYGRIPAPFRAMIARAVRAWPVSDKKVTVSYLLKRFVDADGLDGLERHLLWTSQVPPHLLARLGVPPVEPVARPRRDGPLLDALQENDLETSLAEGLLTKADRATMGSAIELRAPYLDVDVMEAAARLPRHERVRGLTTKVFLKRYATRYLPREVVYRRKRGLSVPLAAWLRGPLHDWADGLLGSDRLREAGIAPGKARELLADHRARRADLARPLWTILVLSVWLAWLAGIPAARPRYDETRASS
jgi:asparagine synthase (glutamine-hydrolysing)